MDSSSILGGLYTRYIESLRILDGLGGGGERLGSIETRIFTEMV